MVNDLKFYKTERVLFEELYKQRIKGKEIQTIFNKLVRHYKLDVLLIHRARYHGYFRGRPYGSTIDLPKEIALGLLAHEIAHAIDYKKRKTSNHDKKLMTVLTRVNNYCAKKNYWRKENGITNISTEG